MRNLLIIMAACLLVAGCKKDNIVTTLPSCPDLKQGLISDNVALVKKTIDDYINALPSNLHTADNLAGLAAYISQNCTEAFVFCHACIMTYPEQSEIVITADSSGIAVKRVIDISGHENEKMKCVNMHRYN